MTNHPARLLLMTLALLPSSTEARIGETFDECKARYGQIIFEDRAGGRLQCNKDGIIVILNFHEGRADLISFTKRSEGPLSREELGHLTMANAGGRRWVRRRAEEAGDEAFETEDGALLATHRTIYGTLIIETMAHRARARAALKEKMRAF